jgi:hypothetical protein
VFQSCPYQTKISISSERLQTTKCHCVRAGGRFRRRRTQMMARILGQLAVISLACFFTGE